MAGAQKFDIFMSKYSIWTAYKSGLGLKFGGRPYSHQLIIEEVYFHTFSGQKWIKQRVKKNL